MPETRSYLSQITLPSGSTYYLKDEEAHALIAELTNYTKFLGVTTTELTEGSTTTTIVINGESVTAARGNIATYGSKEFIFNGTAWQEFGDLSGLGMAGSPQAKTHDAFVARAKAIGDDTLQEASRGRVVPDSFTHGSSAQRVHWLKEGLQTGKISSCDTFGSGGQAGVDEQ